MKLHFPALPTAALLLALTSTFQAQPLAAQQPATPAPAAIAGWERVKSLPPRASLHVTTDHGGKSCRVSAVTDDALLCSHGHDATTTIPRAEIQHIKFTHYGRSTLTGAAIGGGAGAIAGAIGGRTKPCPAGQGLCLNNIGIGAGGVAAIFAVAGAVLGAAIGGPTDFTRGASIYTRP